MTDLEDLVERLERAVSLIEIRQDQRKTINALRRIEAKLEVSSGKELDMSAALDQIQEDVDALIQSKADILAAIAAVADGMTGALTEEEVAEKAAALRTAVDGFSDMDDAISSLNPSVPGGSVEPAPEG